MPRRLPIRPAKLIGNLFVLFVISVIAFVYYVYVVEVWAPKAQCKFYVLLIEGNILGQGLLAIFHVLFLLLTWSFI